MLEFKMKYFLFLLYISVSWAADAEGNESPDEFSSSTAESETTQPSTTTSTTSSPPDYLSSYSDLQEISASDIDSNEKIQKKIINAFSEFSSGCNNYKPIDLSLDEFTFKKKQVTVDLEKDKVNASFSNFTFVEESDSDVGSIPYSILVRCDSSENSKVEVTLPKNIKIFANVQVNSSNGNAGSITKGSIFILLKNVSVVKEFTIQTNNYKQEYDIKRAISYLKTEVLLAIDIKYQKPIYDKFHSFLNETESPLQEYFVDKLTSKLAENGVSVSESCSKFVNVKKKSEKFTSPSSTDDLSNIYVISKETKETWKGVNLTLGPIIIQGLSEFNSIEMIISGTELSTSLKSADHDLSTQSVKNNVSETKEATVRIRTNGLRGRLNWKFDLKPIRSFSFFIDSILFEIRKSKSFRDKREAATTVPKYFYPYNESATDANKLDINLVLGNININSSSSNSNIGEIEREFVNFVLTEYLKTILNDTLIKSFNDKLQNNPSVVNC
ncbi:uncharacterized protein LOC135839458 [Planococcus citri]|uniref:uncharacterized protein LOC135839458 n=1 Tax=Planococcus citri TaxID=170843 RepID=UPI0031FA2BC4